MKSKDDKHCEILDDIKEKMREQGMGEACLKFIEKFYPKSTESKEATK